MQALKNVRKLTNSGSLPRSTFGKLHFSQFRGSGASSTWKSGKEALPGMAGIFQSRLSRSVKCGLVLVPLVASMAVTVALADADPSTANFITLESGLKYRDLKVGDGECPKRRDIVKVHYTGWLEGFDSGKKFDSSYDRHNPIAFKVGTGQVIAGWDEGILAGLKVGGERELIIPPHLGYGHRGAGRTIPPGATLYFRIKLVAVN